MIKRFFPVLFLLLLCFQCDEDIDDCSAVLCAGPPALALRILENGGNVFANETYALEDIVITGENNSEIMMNIFETEDGTPLLILDNFPWQLGENNYTLTFSRILRQSEKYFFDFFLKFPLRRVGKFSVNLFK